MSMTSAQATLIQHLFARTQSEEGFGTVLGQAIGDAAFGEDTLPLQDLIRDSQKALTESLQSIREVNI